MADDDQKGEIGMKRRDFLGLLAMTTTPAFAQQEKTTFPIEIKIDGKAYPAVLLDNAAGRAIRSQLPLKLKMADLYGRELCYRFGAPLPTDHVAYTGYEVGEIVYWPPRHSFVIMYAQNGEMFDMQKVGKILSPLPRRWPRDVEVEMRLI